MSIIEKTLFFRLGQILKVNETQNEKVIVFAKLKNPTFRTFESQYIGVNINTFLYLSFHHETTLSPVLTNSDIFSRAKDYYQIDLKSTYANLKKAVEKFNINLNKNNTSNNYEFEIMSEQEFCSLY